MKAEKEFAELSKQREQQFASKAEAVFGTYKSTAAELANKFPELFKYDAEKEKDLADAFASGERLADTAFVGFADNTGDPDTPLKLARVQGAVRMRAAALVPTLMKLRKAEEENKGLREKLSAYEKAEPAAGISRQNGSEPEKSWGQEIEELAATKR